ncbi:Serine racemase [Galdieria sulphuraria]|uniref:Threonine dehydratase n=1 Tax=Galdieria sulphuraria TaxID=130081 RepID=M2XPF4_GALSU|nr:threonine dehydratase [Galdieria sulphuraria]EME32082.1 threonine dehydratase [Galdieria sulphuraria]GJD06680.1 Serine racemase [Galdieria sulphuraria]|eukprot:XP_005708602.1 threonine dehydratase [Galdieria sulphuraria]
MTKQDESLVDNIIAAESRLLQLRANNELLIRRTPLDLSHPLSKELGAQVFLKLESEQVTGTFKVRGAFNKLLNLHPLHSHSPVVTASTGNHGAAVAHAGSVLKIPICIFLPRNVQSTKVDKLSNYDVELRYEGNDCLEAELTAKRYAEERQGIYISPYNDWDIVAGQGTIAPEICQQLGSSVDIIYVTVGGGGLIGGMAAYLKAIFPHCLVIGCLPENSPVMYRCVQAGEIIEYPCSDTLSDASAGGVEPGSITFSLCQQYVDDYVLVNEEEISENIRYMVDKHKKIVEGAAAVAIAACRKDRQRQMSLNKSKLNIVVVVCGSNIGYETLKKCL